MLPPGGERWRFSSWGGDDETNTPQYIALLAFLEEHQLEHVPIELALVHRADNDYNPNAIAVVTPAGSGGDVDSRHLGYLPDSDLWKVGMGLIPDLADFAGGEIACTGLVVEGYESKAIALSLPGHAELAKAIDDFLGPDRVRWRHSQPTQKTEVANADLRAFDENHEPVSNITISTELSFRGPFRYLRVTDAASKRFLGDVDRGHLFLKDERERPNVSALLAAAGVPVAEVIQQPVIPLTEEWPITTAPNIHTHRKVDFLSFHLRGVLIAQLNLSTRKLWVEDNNLLGATLCYAARAGIEVREIGLPRAPWGLVNEVHPRDMRDQDFRDSLVEKQEASVERMLCRLVASVQAAGLDDVLSEGAIMAERWRADDINSEPLSLFRVHEVFVAPRQQLFGAHTLTARSKRCRLCGQRGFTFKSALCVEPLTYCHQCLERACRGMIEDRPIAARALGMLGQLEFDGVPMLEAQLDALHINTASPLHAPVIDKLLMLRFVIRRRKFPWTYLLEEAGFFPGGLRLGWGTLIRARDGHLCFSLGEKTVCDFLHQHGIKHDREPFYPIDPDFNPHGLRRADWKLDDLTFVEFWGMPNDPKYAAKMRQKRQLAQRRGLTLIELTERELPTLPTVFSEWLPTTVTGTSWVWSRAVTDLNDESGVNG
ncbi:hypothetical protein [Sinomonas gamaensis]|uniref:hypothetical protein n=1 Tax=Sinomonas gamaensis TaxID=2565624 RepID=UPI0011090C12|nr:hypothetical protein [Sinomonas gamaensis]